MDKIKTTWNAKFYDSQCGFVSQYGKEILVLLAPKKNERILDLGCGTGILSNEIAKLGAHVVGIDSSPEMIKEAKHNYPDLVFKVEDGHDFSFKMQFDAVFSNAALHWMLEPKRVINCVWQCLKNGGRFVFEMGGNHNLQHVLFALESTAHAFGVTDIQLINYFPKLGEYTSLLEEQGFRVVYAKMFDRPIKLEGRKALRNWVYTIRH